MHNGREAENQKLAWNGLKLCQKQATSKTRVVQAIKKSLPSIYSEKRLVPKKERPKAILTFNQPNAHSQDLHLLCQHSNSYLDAHRPGSRGPLETLMILFGCGTQSCTTIAAWQKCDTCCSESCKLNEAAATLPHIMSFLNVEGCEGHCFAFCCCRAELRCPAATCFGAVLRSAGTGLEGYMGELVWLSGSVERLSRRTITFVHGRQ